MAEATLLGYKIIKIDMLNVNRGHDDLEVGNRFRFNAQFTPDNKRALAGLVETLEMKNHREVFHIDLGIEGVFDVTGVVDTETRKDVHIMCYDLLFPIAYQILEFLVSNSDLSGLDIKKVPLKRESIHFGEETEDSKIIDFPPQ